jgi:hypothetical protein
MINGLTVEPASGPVGANVLTLSQVSMLISINTAAAAANKVILLISMHLCIRSTIPPEENAA